MESFTLTSSEFVCSNLILNESRIERLNGSITVCNKEISDFPCFLLNNLFISSHDFLFSNEVSAEGKYPNRLGILVWT